MQLASRSQVVETRRYRKAVASHLIFSAFRNRGTSLNFVKFMIRLLSLCKQTIYMSEHNVCFGDKVMSNNTTVDKSGTLMIPSDPSKVTVENLWRVMNVITRIGRTFQKEDIAGHPDSPYRDKIAIGRILAYLKYLEVVNESREKIEGEAGKVQRVQKFTVTDKAQKFYYLLQDGRREGAAVEWSNLMKEHDLYKIVAKEFSQSKKTTIRELQDIIWKAYGGKHKSSFYRNGAEFVAELLSKAGLVEFDRSSGLISLREYVTKKKPPTQVTVVHPTEVTGPPIGPDFMEFSYEGLYLKIKPDRDRIELAKGVLDLIEKQLQTKKEKTVNEERRVGKAEAGKTS